MLDKDLLDLAYDLTRRKITDSTGSLTFNQICDLVIDETKIPKNKFDDIVGSFYTDLLQDSRFVFIGNNKWTLRELQTLDFLKNNQSSLYSYEDDKNVQEVYDEDSLPTSMVEAENEIYEEKDFEISRDSLELSNNNDSDDKDLESDLSDSEIEYEYDN